MLIIHKEKMPFSLLFQLNSYHSQVSCCNWNAFKFMRPWEKEPLFMPQIQAIKLQPSSDILETGPPITLNRNYTVTVSFIYINTRVHFNNKLKVVLKHMKRNKGNFRIPDVPKARSVVDHSINQLRSWLNLSPFGHMVDLGHKLKHSKMINLEFFF